MYARMHACTDSTHALTHQAVTSVYTSPVMNTFLDGGKICHHVTVVFVPLFNTLGDGRLDSSLGRWNAALVWFTRDHWKSVERLGKRSFVYVLVAFVDQYGFNSVQVYRHYHHIYNHHHVQSPPLHNKNTTTITTITKCILQYVHIFVCAHISKYASAPWKNTTSASCSGHAHECKWSICAS